MGSRHACIWTTISCGKIAYFVEKGPETRQEICNGQEKPRMLTKLSHATEINYTFGNGKLLPCSQIDSHVFYQASQSCPP